MAVKPEHSNRNAEQGKDILIFLEKNKILVAIC